MRTADRASIKTLHSEPRAASAFQLMRSLTRVLRPGEFHRVTAALTLCLTLSACATKPVEPIIQVKEVRVPVVKECVASSFPGRPEAPSRSEITSATPEDRTKLLGAYFVLMDPWSQLADKQLTACK